MKYLILIFMVGCVTPKPTFKITKIQKPSCREKFKPIPFNKVISDQFKLQAKGKVGFLVPECTLDWTTFYDNSYPLLKIERRRSYNNYVSCLKTIGEERKSFSTWIALSGTVGIVVGFVTGFILGFK